MKSSIPQLPPRHAILTPFTLSTRYGAVLRSSDARTAGEFSAPGVSEATHEWKKPRRFSGMSGGIGSAGGISRIPSWLTSTISSLRIFASVGSTSTRRRRPALSSRLSS